MTTANILGSLKIDLGITTTAYDERLTQYINAAITEITREGASVTEEVETEEGTETQVKDTDSHLVIMYAAWMWRRRDGGEGMPRMVRYALNNRVFQEKMQEV